MAQHFELMKLTLWEEIVIGIVATLAVALLSALWNKFRKEIKKHSQLKSEPISYSDKNLHAVAHEFWIAFPSFVLLLLAGSVVDLSNTSFLQGVIIVGGFFTGLFTISAFMVLQEIVKDLRKALTDKPAQNTTKD